ncbi:GFA family protein [Aspergillus clavatus NRRL 1]|uniref:DUF636 domain protein n=1 Tax=Aspergillus clavatus (strain ATCC 1007 / CBS 513.65 / DSM 816 / NCTC 3887 / NRRL 1 / QM 1276 / 107) TaxID=344612 RepID=A1CCT7_ASPCL|nr:DUF636 domain protein [Aspergillus clavatus NRRL 1]EAW12344.1 DUF636 domain protein [Aspergillus clavatus NRRL 1]
MAQKSMTGTCLCNAITYRIDLPASEPTPKVILCHCINCKRYTGSGFSANIVVPKSGLHWTKGQPKLFIDKSDEGLDVPRMFCGDCGAHFTSEPSGDHGRIVIKTGTLDEPYRQECGELVVELWCKRKDKWVDAMKEENVQRLDASM